VGGVIEPPDRNREHLISTSEIAAYANCPEQWRLAYGLGLEPGNRQAMHAGT